MKLDEKPFHKINLNISWADPKYKEEAIRSITCRKFPIHNIWQLPKHYINPELVDLMRGMGFTGLKGYFFATPVHSSSVIHIDSNTLMNDKWALNWSWGSEDHDMTWYLPKPDYNLEMMRNAFATGASTKFLAFAPDSVDMLDTTVIDEHEPTLVKIGIPHRVANRSNNVRWSISIRDEGILDSANKDKGWDYIVEKIAKYI